jgi:hypothetical protein
MFAWFRKYIKKIGIFGIEVVFRPPTDTVCRVIISFPEKGTKLSQLGSEVKPIRRCIAGRVEGFSSEQIQGLGLSVEILIKTDRWYPQGRAEVQPDGCWFLLDGYFGGEKHLVRALLKDRNGCELASADNTVWVS